MLRYVAGGLAAAAFAIWAHYVGELRQQWRAYGTQRHTVIISLMIPVGSLTVLGISLLPAWSGLGALMEWYSSFDSRQDAYSTERIQLRVRRYL